MKLKLDSILLQGSHNINLLDDRFSCERLKFKLNKSDPLKVSVLEADIRQGHYLSCVVRKPGFRVSNQVRHKPGCTATKDG